MSEDRIVTVISSTSCEKLDTPFVNYFRAELAKEIGEEQAENVIAYTYKEVAQMDEGAPCTPIEFDMSRYGYPMLAMYRGLVRLGYSREESLSFVQHIWKKIPKELKARPWEEML